MKTFFASLTILVLFASCKGSGKTAVPDNSPIDSLESKKPYTFFPVTDYLKGQLVDIRNSGVNPIKYVVTNGKTDSNWIKVETLETEMAEFLNPVIDSAHLDKYFVETSFVDQTINAITLTYDPKIPLPDSVRFIHWDIYIDPEKNTVQKIYLEKKLDSMKRRQLTWQSGKQCRAITVSEAPDGKIKTESEVIFKWDF